MILSDVVRELLEKADKWGEGNVNEADTKALFIEPLLRVLGWDVTDLDAVTREYRVFDGTLIDYVLKIAGTPRLVVEAKPLDKSLDDNKFIAQTVNYANNAGIVWCVLTNGLRYRVYKSNELADMERKLLFEIDLRDARDEVKGQVVADRLTYLSRDSIESGSLDEWGERTFTDGRVKAALIQVLSNPQTKIVNLVVEKLGGGASFSPARVKDSLRRMATLLSGDESSAAVFAPRTTPSVVRIGELPPPPVTELRTGWVALDQLTVASHQPPPSQIRLPDGTTRPLKYWKNLLVEVARYLVEKGMLGPQDCPVVSSRKRYLVHTDPQHPNGNRFRQPVRIDGLWVETHKNAGGICSSAKLLIGHAGVKASSFEVCLA